MIKPAFKSLEGQSYGSVMAYCMYLLNKIIGSESPTDPAEVARQAVGLATSGQWIPVAQMVAILGFMYFYSHKFTDSRVELKKNEK